MTLITVLCFWQVHCVPLHVQHEIRARGPKHVILLGRHFEQILAAVRDCYVNWSSNVIEESVWKQDYYGIRSLAWSVRWWHTSWICNICWNWQTELTSRHSAILWVLALCINSNRQFAAQKIEFIMQTLRDSIELVNCIGDALKQIKSERIMWLGIKLSRQGAEEARKIDHDKFYKSSYIRL